MRNRFRLSSAYLAMALSLVAIALAAPAFLAAASISAQAETLEVTWVEPGEPGLSELWDQSSNPTPVNFTASETIVAVTNSNPSGLSPIVFFTLAATGGFIDHQNFVSTSGPQVYSGSQSNPVFAPGSFTLLDDHTGKDGTLTFAAVPEPSTCAMLLLGFVGLAFAGYRQSRRTAVTA